MEDRELLAAEGGIYRGHIFRQAEIVADPVHVPGEVTEGNAIDLAGRRVDIFFNRLGNLGKLVEVVGTAGKVHIAENQQPVCVAASLGELEVHLLGDRGVLGEGLVVARHNSVLRHFVAGRNDDEDILPLLLGLYGVVAVAVGLHYIDTVGNEHSLHRVALASDGAVYIALEVRIIRYRSRVKLPGLVGL